MITTSGNIPRDLHPIDRPEDGFFNGYAGKKIDLLKPTLDMIDIQSIAAALSKICRFNGHINDFYSVAQHSVLVSMLAPRELQRAALLHDAAEAYLGDVIKPLKILLGDVYLEREVVFDMLICEKFRITQKQLQEVKYYDKRAIDIEFSHFFKGGPELAKIFSQDGGPCWDHRIAEEMFHYHYQEVKHA